MSNSVMSPRLVISYVLDWIIIIAIAAAGGGMSYITPYHRAFSLLNLDISYPLVSELISIQTLVLVGLLAPAIIILLVCLAVVPGPCISRRLDRSEVIRLKLWELEKGWAGLALSVATAYFITQGAKNLFGKPRPDLLARCQPDLSDIASHVVGGFGQDISARWTLVKSTICTQKDMGLLDDGFRSFPSGHSSFSWSGLLYVSLFLCSKFSIAIPHLPVTPISADSIKAKPSSPVLPLHHERDNTEEADKRYSGDTQTGYGTPATARDPVMIRDLAAAPPVYLVIPAFTPIAVAFFICSTRYVEYFHFGFDIISGSLIGILAAWFSFRWYHFPLSRGQGWAWGARSGDRAFGIGVGTGGYVGEAGVTRLSEKREDVEVAAGGHGSRQ